MMGIKRDFIGMFDVMKGILMLMVLMIHHIAFNQAVLPSGMVDMLSQATRYGVTAIALFFMVSGYTLRREENWRGYARRQARQLLVPYFVMMVICVGLRAFFALCMGRFRIQVISPVALAFLYGSNTPFELFGEIWVTSVVAFWFLPVLFFGGVLRQLLWRIGNTALQALCLWGLVAAAVSFPSTDELQLPWFLVQSCTALGYLEIGRLLRQHKVLFRRLPLAFVLAATLLWLFLHRYSNAGVAANLWPFWMLDYLGGAAFGVVVLRLYIRSGFAAARYTGLLSYIGRYSLYFLCMHGMELIVLPWGASMRRPLLELSVPSGVLFWGILLLRLLFVLAGCLLIQRGKLWLQKKRMAGRPVKKRN